MKSRGTAELVCKYFKSPSVRRAWIEIEDARKRAAKLPVTLREEGVD